MHLEMLAPHLAPDLVAGLKLLLARRGFRLDQYLVFKLISGLLSPNNSDSSIM